MNFIESLGYLASFIIFISLTMKSIVRLRIVNAIGCLLFAVFAIKTNSLPAVAMNIGIVFIDMYYLYKLLKIKENFEILEVSKDNEIVRYFLEKNKAELRTFFGEEAYTKSSRVALYFRNTDIAGLAAYSIREENNRKAAYIAVDFVVAKYRDLAVGKQFFINDTGFWKQLGCTVLVVENPTPGHIAYIKQLGFTDTNNTNIWYKEI
ncbi:MAG: hypothetical protein ACTTH8_04880 [Treponema sp.]